MKAVLAVGLLIVGTPLSAAELKKLTVEELPDALVLGRLEALIG